MNQTMTQAETRIDDGAFGALRAVFAGELIRSADPGYDAARQVWNGNVDRRPAMIARCQGVADVQRALAFAIDRGLTVSVRGGGHSAPGYGTNDGGLVIDLSPLKGIRVDPTTSSARAQGGVLWRELDHETQAFGLATTGGTVSNTGIAGLTLGGGLGWLMGKHGLTVDNLLSADVITADGTFRTVSADTDADLFWALRGGGGNFGVVVSLEYALHPRRHGPRRPRRLRTRPGDGGDALLSRVLSDVAGRGRGISRRAHRSAGGRAGGRDGARIQRRPARG